MHQGAMSVDAEHGAQKRNWNMADESVPQPDRARATRGVAAAAAASTSHPTARRGANCWSHRRAPACAASVPLCLQRALALLLLPP